VAATSLPRKLKSQPVAAAADKRMMRQGPFSMLTSVKVLTPGKVLTYGKVLTPAQMLTTKENTMTVSVVDLVAHPSCATTIWCVGLVGSDGALAFGISFVQQRQTSGGCVRSAVGVSKAQTCTMLLPTRSTPRSSVWMLQLWLCVVNLAPHSGELI
jgi:hypothetical protein